MRAKIINISFMIITLSVIEVDNIFVRNQEKEKKTNESNSTYQSVIRPIEFESYPCKDNNDIVSNFKAGVEKGYKITIKEYLEVTTEIKVKLDSSGAIIFGDDYENPSNEARFTEKDIINNVFAFILRKSKMNFSFIIKGRHAPEHPPYVLSLKIDGVEKCVNPDRTYFSRFDPGVQKFWPKAADRFCGRRRINREYNELIVSGTPSKIGNWPWHVALYRNFGLSVQYICGGTLISKFVVLTAAHCVTIDEVPLNPQALGVILGRTSLLTNEVTSQERTVLEVIPHEGYKKKSLDDDIALLKLSTEAVFNNYVQPACLWIEAAYDQLDSYEVMGSVVGWGIDQTESLANNLHEATMPEVSKLTCIEYEPIFYTTMLSNGKKFCAGHANGTAACNGDSGGGFVVFVPDSRSDGTTVDYKIGAWYVKGIVSVTLVQANSKYCNPNAYTVFTNVEKYKEWISRHIN